MNLLSRTRWRAEEHDVRKPCHIIGNRFQASSCRDNCDLPRGLAAKPTQALRCRSKSAARQALHVRENAPPARVELARRGWPRGTAVSVADVNAVLSNMECGCGTAYAPPTPADEAVVRAVVVRFIAAHQCAVAAQEEIEAQQKLGFVATAKLSAVFEEYQRAQSRYQSFEQVMPQVIAALRDAGR